MPAKRGRLGQDEREFIIVNAGRISAAEIAAKLNRTEATVADFISSRAITTPPTKEQTGRSEGLLIRSELRASEKWRRLKEELTTQELKFFEEEFIKLLSQFRGDVLPSEETQVFDCIKFEILKSRNMVERRKARESITRLESEHDAFRAAFDSDTGKMSPDEKKYGSHLESRLQNARVAERDCTVEYVKLQERHDALMKSLKSTRDQRIREVETGKETILGLFKTLQKKEVQDYEGRQSELMRLAAEKEYNRLGQLHEYEDGSLDRPILSPETVDLAEEDNG